MRVKHRYLIDFAIQKFFRAKFRDRLGLDEARRVLELKIRQQFALGSGNELTRFSARDYENGFRLVELRDFTK